MEKEKLDSVKEYMAELGRRSWAVRKERHGKKLTVLLSKAGRIGGINKKKFSTGKRLAKKKASAILEA